MEVAYDTSPDYSVSPMGGLIFEEVHPEALEYIRPRKIDDWQIQFEIPELGFELEQALPWADRWPKHSVFA